MNKPDDEDAIEFLTQSNYIEKEYSIVALESAFRAWRYALQVDLWTIVRVKETHYRLMKHLNPRIAGRLRHVGVRVWGRDCPSWTTVERLLADWCTLPTVYGETIKLHGWREIKQSHINFEHVHPFRDGNGRVGRIIMNAQRVKAGLPILIIHEGKEEMDYYKWF